MHLELNDIQKPVLSLKDVLPLDTRKTFDEKLCYIQYIWYVIFSFYNFTLYTSGWSWWIELGSLPLIRKLDTTFISSVNMATLKTIRTLFFVTRIVEEITSNWINKSKLSICPCGRWSHDTQDNLALHHCGPGWDLALVVCVKVSSGYPSFLLHWYFIIIILLPCYDPGCCWGVNPLTKNKRVQLKLNWLSWVKIVKCSGHPEIGHVSGMLCLPFLPMTYYVPTSWWKYWFVCCNLEEHSNKYSTESRDYNTWGF